MRQDNNTLEAYNRVLLKGENYFNTVEGLGTVLQEMSRLVIHGSALEALLNQPDRRG